MTWHDPLSLGNDPIFRGSWRLQEPSGGKLYFGDISGVLALFCLLGSGLGLVETILDASLQEIDLLGAGF